VFKLKIAFPPLPFEASLLYLERSIFRTFDEASEGVLLAFKVSLLNIIFRTRSKDD
jgi:hypothetical protein